MYHNHVLVSLWIFQQLLHHAKQVFCLVCRNAVESESTWLLALAEEVSEKALLLCSVNDRHTCLK